MRNKLMTLLLVACMFVLSTGFACNTATWLSRVTTILNEIGPAAQIITSLLPLLGVQVPKEVTDSVNAWVPRVRDDAAQLSTEVQTYANDLSNPTVQAKLNAMIQTTQQDILSILPVFRVFDPKTQQNVTNVINGLSAGVLSVENMINAAEGKTSVLKAPAKGQKLSRNGKDFKHNFNQTLHTSFPQATELK